MAAVLGSLLLLSACTPTVPLGEHHTPDPTAPSSSPTAVAVPASPVDTGESTGATGPIELDDAGRPAKYTVVSGDTALQIAVRFSVEIDQLADTEGRRLGNYPTLYVGDQIIFLPPLTGSEAACFYETYNDVGDLAGCKNDGTTK